MAPSEPPSAFDWLERLPEVCETGDRRAVPSLLAFLVDESLPPALRRDVAETLLALEDVRCVEPLERILFDRDATGDTKGAALAILTMIPRDAPDRETGSAWMDSRDPWVCAYGLGCADVPDAARIVTALAHPETPVRRAAADALVGIVRTPELVDALRRSFQDPDAVVREFACRAALFDEPVSTTWELLRAVRDESFTVRHAAYDALEDYPCIAVLLALADARGGGSSDEQPADSAEHVLQLLLARTRQATDDAGPEARLRLERWTAPVRWLLDEEPSPGHGVVADDGIGDAIGDAILGGISGDLDHEADQPPAVDVEAARAILLGDVSLPWVQREVLSGHDWTNAGEAGLEVARACATSKNWSIRQGAVSALSGLGAADDVLELAHDREPIVVRAAMLALRRDEDARVLPVAIKALGNPFFRPTAGDAALAAVARFAPRARVVSHVVAELERPDNRDGLVLGASTLARTLEIEDARPALTQWVESPLISGAAPHVNALRALRELGPPSPGPDLSHLDEVDHLDVQRELGEWGFQGRRFV